LPPAYASPHRKWPYRLDHRHCDGAAKNSDAKQITASKESTIPLADPARAYNERTTIGLPPSSCPA
jgi:hypothetical protein